MTVLFLYLARRRKYLATGWLWYLGTLLPVIGLIQVGSQAYADRYTYIPFIGLFMMIAWGAAELLARLPHRKFVLGFLAAIVLTPMGLYTHRQVGFWKNGVALFSHAIEVTLNNTTAYNNLSAAYNELGNFEEAIEAAQQAIKINPDYIKAYDNLSAAYFFGLDYFEQAIEVAQQAIKINPNYAPAKNNLAWILATTSDPKWQNPEEAVRFAQKACELTDYKNGGFLDTLAVAYASADRFDEAVSTAEKALELAEAAGNKNLAQEIKGRLKLFRQGRSYSEQINN